MYPEQILSLVLQRVSIMESNVQTQCYPESKREETRKYEIRMWKGQQKSKCNYSKDLNRTADQKKE